MLVKHTLESLTEVSVFLSLFTVGAICLRRAFKEFRALLLFLSAYALQQSTTIVLLLFRHQLHLTPVRAYQIVFYTYWPLFVIQAILMMCIIYSIYSEALRPFQPLRKLGMLIFKWVAAISVAVGLGIALGPHMLSANFIGILAGQAEQFVNIVTLCLLLFVCFALRPLGINFDSRLFGTSLGMAVYTTSNMLQAAWLSTSAAKSFFSPIYLIGGVGALAAILIWTVYFVRPEGERRTLLLPTTSPYFLWNRISEALGDAPGFVAVNGVAQDMFSEHELEAFAEAHPDRQTIVVSPTLMRPATATR